MGDTDQIISSKPLFKAIGDDRGERARWARSLGELPQTLTNWEKRGIPRSKVGDVAAAMGISYEEYMRLAGGKRATIIPINAARRAPDATVTIEVMNAKATGAKTTGFPRPERDQVIDRVTVHRRFIEVLPRITKTENLRVITAFGESMKPTILPGDMLIVDVGVKETDVDGIYVLSAKDELFIKRIRRRVDGSRWIISDNNPSGEPPEALSGKHEVTMEGRVVWRWHGEAM